MTLCENTTLYEAFESFRGVVVLLEKVVTVGPVELPTYPDKRIYVSVHALVIVE